MNRIACLISLAALTGIASAQAHLVLPKTRFDSLEPIGAAVRNDGRKPITLCVELSQWFFHGDETNFAPSPFLFQIPAKRKWKQLFRKKWATILIGPDIGSIRAPAVLQSGRQYDFPFRLDGHAAELRLLLYYWDGDREDACSVHARGARKVASIAFQIGP